MRLSTTAITTNFQEWKKIQPRHLFLAGPFLIKMSLPATLVTKP